MARYTVLNQDRQKFGEPIRRAIAKRLQKKNYPPGTTRKVEERSSRGICYQLSEKQKAKYIYGVLERQLIKCLVIASRKVWITGERSTPASRKVIRQYSI